MNIEGIEFIELLLKVFNQIHLHVLSPNGNLRLMIGLRRFVATDGTSLHLKQDGKCPLNIQFYDEWNTPAATILNHQPEQEE